MLLQLVETALQERQRADENYKKAVRQAQSVGILIDESPAQEPDFKFKSSELQIYPEGPNGSTGHWVIRLAHELSPACLAELSEKIAHGRVIYNRAYGQGPGWWNHNPTNSSSTAD
jgi:hypothetical protein